MANRKPLVSKSAKPMDTFDFLIRFWALRAKQAEKGTPLLPSEETELLTLLQVVGGMEPPLASAPKGVSFSAAGLALTLAPSLWLVVTGLAVCSTGVFLCQSATISSIARNV